MARLFALVGNRQDLGSRVLQHEREALAARKLPSAVGWGLGFYQGGEVLLRRRPLDAREDLDFSEIATDVRSDVVIGHIRTPTIGSLETENTHPFRYRQWLYAQTGTVPHFSLIRSRLLESIPEFLRGSIRGDTDAEVVFHLLLSFLYDDNALRDSAAAPEAVASAVRSTFALLEGIVAEHGIAPIELNMIVCGGESAVAARRGSPMALREFQGRRDAEALIGDDVALRRKVPELDRVHFTLVASDLDDGVPLGGWSSIESGGVVIVERDSWRLVE